MEFSSTRDLLGAGPSSSLVRSCRIMSDIFNYRIDNECPVTALMWGGGLIHSGELIEQAERAHSLFMSIEISGIYIYIYMFA